MVRASCEMGAHMLMIQPNRRTPKMQTQVKMKLVNKTKNCYRYEAHDDSIVKSALYIKNVPIEALNVPDEILVTIEAAPK